jgi:hypothetical protein
VFLFLIALFFLFMQVQLWLTIWAPYVMSKYIFSWNTGRNDLGLALTSDLDTQQRRKFSRPEANIAAPIQQLPCPDRKLTNTYQTWSTNARRVAYIHLTGGPTHPYPLAMKPWDIQLNKSNMILTSLCPLGGAKHKMKSFQLHAVGVTFSAFPFYSFVWIYRSGNALHYCKEKAST